MVRCLAAEAGIRQFLGIGTGLPTSPNVHEVAHGIIPEALIVYVDNDPVALAHANALLTGTGTTKIVLADLRDPEQILAGARDFLDFTKPVGMVRVARAGTTVNMGPPFGNKTTGRDGLVLDYVLGTAWHAESAEVVGAVQALIDQGHVGPAAIRDIGWTLWQVTPFYCPDCGLNYRSSDWDTCALFDDGFYDCTKGNCPKGHQHMLDD